MSSRILRVVVRGELLDLTDGQRSSLLAEVGEHEIFRARYTPEGTFTYDANLSAFSFRYEVRLDADVEAPLAAAVDLGLANALADLHGWGLAHKHLRATATDMASMWVEP